MQGRLVVIKGITFTRYKNPVEYDRITKDKFTQLMLAEQKLIAKKYGKEYSICYVNCYDNVDMSIIPSGITVKQVTWLSSLHVLFEKMEEKEEEIC